MSKKKNNAVAIYDFRYNEDKFTSVEELKTLLNNKGIFKKWIFQLEEGEENGYLHYQGRFSLVKKVRPSTILNYFENKPNFVRPTCKEEAEKYKRSGEAFYQTKEHTRKGGPWCDKDEVLYIPRQIREIKQLRPFQQQIIDDAGNWDTRTINMVYCPEGNKGKSLLVGYCRAYKIGRALPPVNDYKDMMRMVCDMPTAKMYLIDMPRSINKDRLYQFYAGVESLKDGFAYDDRYRYTEKVFDCPNIWIFSNRLPDMSLLSKDRWKIWKINDTFELEGHELEPV